ncbi:hypothetical protein MHMDBK_00428 [Mesomycoplasma hyorhinis]|nr:hypothetical protein MHMDBK_00428 [Mesomycoplasma hyorhinis]
MKKYEFYKSVTKTYLMFFLIGVFVFAICVFWSYHLIVGWFFSLISVLSSIFLTWIFEYKILIKVKKTQKKYKKVAVAISLFYILILVHIVFIVILIVINVHFPANVIKTPLQKISRPINLFTFLVGITLFPISIIVSKWKKIKKRKERKC